MNRLLVIATTLSLAAFALLAGGCGSSSQITRVFEDPDYRRASFSNVLVIAVADDYDSRAQFERQLSSALRATGAMATPYYTVIGHNPEVTRSDVSNAVRARKFDAVLLTRVKGQESSISVKGSAPETKTTRRNENAFDLFRYDYEELNDPDRIEVSTTIVLVTELYSARDEKKVWAIESTSFEQPGIAQIIDSQVESISGQLRRDRMLGR